MNDGEHPLTFKCEGQTLVGVVAIPPRPGVLGVVILPGGPNYRAGAHRQFVHLARRLAAAGIATLRFDYRGMGDSDGDVPGFENVSPDIAAALDALQARCPAVERIALCGLCEGASSALLYCANMRDGRIGALALINPWVRSEATIAKTYLRHHYLRRLLSRNFWWRLLSGDIDVGEAVRDAGTNAKTALRLGNTRTAPGANTFQEEMAKGFRAFTGRVFIALSGIDLTAREFITYTAGDARWRKLLARRSVERCDFAGADHTFSSARWCAELEVRVLEWLARCGAELPSNNANGVRSAACLART